jgi:hypothetical protein
MLYDQSTIYKKHFLRWRRTLQLGSDTVAAGVVFQTATKFFNINIWGVEISNPSV